MTKPTKSAQEKENQKPSISSSKNYKIIPTDSFIDEAKILAKKYPNIKDDFIGLAKTLKVTPKTGDCLGANIYKIEMIISDKKEENQNVQGL